MAGLEKFRLRRLLCLSPRKILLFHNISLEALTNLLDLHSSLAVEFFKNFFTDDFVTKVAEQTNFYAVQRGSFKPVSDGVINLYLYNFGCNLGLAFVERPSNPWVKRS